MPATPEIMITCGCTAAPITPATSPKLAVSPSLKPYTTLRKNPPEPVLCHGSAPLPARSASVPACAADSLASCRETCCASGRLDALWRLRYPLTSSPSSRSSIGRRYRVPKRRPNHARSEEHTSELQSLTNLVCRLLLEK